MFGMFNILRRDRVEKKRSWVDSNYYFSVYPDVKAAGVPAESHFMAYGWREGRNPSQEFHTLFYAARYLGNDLSANPLEHFIAACANGATPQAVPASIEEWREMQRAYISVYFDEDYYIFNYGDNLRGESPLDHFMTKGAGFGYNPSANFVTGEYAKIHSHLSVADVNPFYHALVVSALAVQLRGAPARSGSKPAQPDPKSAAKLTARSASQPPAESLFDRDTAAQHRLRVMQAISPYLDSNYYYKQYPDVARAGINPLVHYVDYGWKEFRNPSEVFNARFYCEQYDFPADVNPLYHYVTVGKQAGYRPNPLGTRLWPRPKAPEASDWDRAVPARPQSGARVTVIIPVYRGYDDTLFTIFSVLTARQNSIFTLLVINDRGPEPELTDTLRGLAARGLFDYVENERNLGFVGSINAGLALCQGDVILLNADTVVYGDWIDRLLAHAREDHLIATITPLSNNASIASYPLFAQVNSLALECSLAELDSFASVANRLRHVETPTGVGFCFYMRRATIDAVGVLDPDFGRGYGEENDFCMRALKAGWKNVIAEDVVVYHSGAVSFAEFREAEYGPGQEVLIAKHPDYLRRVHAFLAADPGKAGRARLDLYRLARRLGPKTAVILAFEGTGGIVTHQKILSTRFQMAGYEVLCIGVHGNMLRIRVADAEKDVYRPAADVLRVDGDAVLLGEFLGWLAPSIIHVHSLAHASWRASIELMKVLAPFGSSLYVTLHDFNSICHRHNLVDDQGRYCETIERERCVSCVRRAANAQDQVDPDDRRLVWHNFLRRARRVLVPSQDTANRAARYFPDVPFLVRPHEERLDAVEPMQVVPKGALKVALIGAIGPHKGSNFLHALALDAQSRKLPISYHVIGYTNITSDLVKVGVQVTGSYASDEECVAFIRKLAPQVCLFPSIWPETYCYALSIALALQIPPIVLDLGAQADRVRESGYGHVISPSMLDAPQAMNDWLLSLRMDDEWGLRRPPHFACYPAFPQDYFDIELPPGTSEQVAVAKQELA